MVNLGVSVSLANVVLWLIVEVFILLMGMTATSLIARHYLNRSLLRGKHVTLNHPPDLVDRLPYNSDLRPVKQSVKLPLTILRFAVVAVSIYIGTGLDSGLEDDFEGFPVSASVAVAPVSRGLLTRNDGRDISAMIKLSCLKIVNNNNVILFKGYAGGGDIVCEDGIATVETVALINFQIRAGFRTPNIGMDITGMNILDSRTESNLNEGIQRSRYSIIMNGTDPLDSSQQISTRIVLIEPLDDDLCLFGVWRSPGAGFVERVDVKLTTRCDLQIVGMDRMLRPKSESLPPRMAFVYQMVDGLLVSYRETNAPRLQSTEVTATITVSALVIGGVAIVISVALAVVFVIATQRSVVSADLMSADGIADLWAAGKDGSGSRELVFRWNSEAEEKGRVVLYGNKRDDRGM